MSVRLHVIFQKIIDIFYGSKKPWQFLLWSGDKDDWSLVLIRDGNYTKTETGTLFQTSQAPVSKSKAL